MTFQQALDFMRHHPWNFYYVDPADPNAGIIDTRIKGLLNDSGYFGAPSTAFADRRLKLDEIGSMINELDMPSGWYDVDKYDFALIDHMIGQVLDGHPDRYIVPRMHMDAPTGWLKANPTEVCVYADGPETAEEIAALIDTRHFDREGDYPWRKQFLVSRQSFSSEKWIADASVALQKLIEHLETSRWKEQILGYMVIFGVYGEGVWWGAWNGGRGIGDKGISHKKNFFRWAVEKYGSLPALRKAWNMPHLTSDTFVMPTPDDRWLENDLHPDWREAKGLRSLLLVDDQRQVDCNEFHARSTVRALDSFCRVIHQYAGKPAGAFYGYTQWFSALCGHTGLNQALASPNIDFMSAPKAYSYTLAGEPGQSQAPGQSIARKKLWVEENDVRSYHRLETHPNDPYSPKTHEETVTCFWRELYRALTYGHTFWWMNINGLNDDWYADDRLVAMFKAQADFFKKWSPVQRKSVTEVLLVEDSATTNHLAATGAFVEGLRIKLDRELKSCGVPVDRFRIEDLLEMDLAQYKFIVFQEAYTLPVELWQQLRARMRPDVHILWNYAAALLDPAYNPENQKAVTGFRTKELTDRMRHRDTYRHVHNTDRHPIDNNYPYLAIVPEDGQEVLQSTPDGHVLTARIRRGEGANTFAADLTLRTPILRKLMEDAGVTFLAPEYCSVLADDKLIGFFPRYDVQIDHRFDGMWRNVITGEAISGKVSFPVRGKKFAIFEKIN